MAENTSVSRLFLGNTTEELASLKGKEKQIVVDTTKNTLVVMDGVTPGGHPLAKEGTKIKSGSDDVIINDSTEATLAEDVTIKNKPWGIALEGEFPDDPEEEAAIAERLPVGGFVTGLIPNGPEDAIPAPYNTEEIITESGEWEAPVAGWYEVTVIGGGAGGRAYSDTKECVGGMSGTYVTKLVWFEKGDTVAVTIGAKGLGYTGASTSSFSSSEGGATTFGEIVAPGGGTNAQLDASLGRYFVKQSPWLTYAPSTRTIEGGQVGGAGLGGGYPTWSSILEQRRQRQQAKWYGGGGAASYIASIGVGAGDGYQGATIIRFYDLRKDTSLSIGDQLVTDLYARLAALEAKVNEGGGV